MRSGRRSPASSRDRLGQHRRGQTTTDFAIGAGIFLIAVGFTFAFIPGMLDPFVGGPGQDRAVIADRVASDLAAGDFGSPKDPYALETKCTLAFFRQVNGGADAPDDCRYDARSSADSIGEAVDIEGLENANITIERDVNGDGDLEVVCRDGTASIDETCSIGTTPIAAGAVPPDTASVVAAQRSVSIDGTQYHLLVRVW